MIREILLRVAMCVVFIRLFFSYAYLYYRRNMVLVFVREGYQSATLCVLVFSSALRFVKPIQSMKINLGWCQLALLQYKMTTPKELQYNLFL